MTCTGLTQNLSQPSGSFRDFQSNCRVNLSCFGASPVTFIFAAAAAAGAAAPGAAGGGRQRRRSLEHDEDGLQDMRAAAAEAGAGARPRSRLAPASRQIREHIRL
jgi:hypothetical protein